MIQCDGRSNILEMKRNCNAKNSKFNITPIINEYYIKPRMEAYSIAKIIYNNYIENDNYQGYR